MNPNTNLPPANQPPAPAPAPAPESAPSEPTKNPQKKGISASLPVIIVVAGVLIAAAIVGLAIFMSK